MPPDADHRASAMVTIVVTIAPVGRACMFVTASVMIEAISRGKLPVNPAIWLATVSAGTTSPYSVTAASSVGKIARNA